MSTRVEMHALLEKWKKAAPVGTVRTWADGSQHQKQRDGTWKQLPGKGKAGAQKEEPKEGEKGKAPQESKAPSFPEKEIPTGRKWVDKVPGLPDQTYDEYFEDGKPKKQRLALHNKIKSKFLDHVPSVPDDQKPQAIVMMGGPASGKSSILKGLDEGQFVRVDPDAVKEMLPEYVEAVDKSARNAAHMAHEESSYLAKEIRAKAMEQRKNLVVDGTGKNADGHIKLIKQLKEQGYHVKLMMPDLDKDTALSRAAERAEKVGRWVPPEFIEEAYSKIPGNFERIAAETDEFALFDTRKFPATLKWSKGADGKETVHDEDFVTEFRKGSKKESVVRLLVRDLRSLVEAKKDLPPADVGDTNKRAADALSKEKKRIDGLPKRYKKGEGIWTANHDDKHL